MAVELLALESFITTGIDLVSDPVETIDLVSQPIYNVALESYYDNTIAVESRIYLEEI